VIKINYYCISRSMNNMKEQTEIGKLKEGRYLVIDDEPCKILGISISKPGKHGAAKSRIDAVGIFDGVKRSIVQPVSAKTYVPVVERKSGQVIAINGNLIQMMDMKDFQTIEISAPGDKVSLIEVGKEIVYLESLGKRKLDFD
jgi:translation initiation factor 5A